MAASGLVVIGISYVPSVKSVLEPCEGKRVRFKHNSPRGGELIKKLGRRILPLIY